MHAPARVLKRTGHQHRMRSNGSPEAQLAWNRHVVPLHQLLHATCSCFSHKQHLLSGMGNTELSCLPTFSSRLQLLNTIEVVDAFGSCCNQEVRKRRLILDDMVWRWQLHTLGCDTVHLLHAKGTVARGSCKFVEAST